METKNLEYRNSENAETEVPLRLQGQVYGTLPAGESAADVDAQVPAERAGAARGGVGADQGNRGEDEEQDDKKEEDEEHAR